MYGPDIPLMFGLTRHHEARRVTGWNNPAFPSAKREPVGRHGVKLMSVQFLVGERQPLAWQSGVVGLLLHQFFERVDWGELDFLVVDLPPGTADAQQFVAGVGLAGVVVVVTPQDVAHLDAKKPLAMFEQGRRPGREHGLVEVSGVRASAATLPSSRRRAVLLGARSPSPGEVPFSPRIGEPGMPVVARDPGSKSALAFFDLAAAVRRLSAN